MKDKVTEKRNNKSAKHKIKIALNRSGNNHYL